MGAYITLYRRYAANASRAAAPIQSDATLRPAH
jgi:hypothetical protein